MISFSEFKKYATQGNLIPLYTEIAADLDTAVTAFAKIATGKNDFLLESVTGLEQWSRYSFLGTNPKTIIRSENGHTRVIEKSKVVSEAHNEDPLILARKYLSQFKPVEIEGLPRFWGGLVGSLSYDMVRYFEKLPTSAASVLKVPDCYLLVADTLVIFDRLKQKLIVVACADTREKSLTVVYKECVKKIKDLVSKLKKPLSPKQIKALSLPLKKMSLKPTIGEAKFSSMVEKAKEYIRAGDIFQVVLSTRFQGPAKVHPFQFYRVLRRSNPSPYMYYLNLDGFSIVGTSPELMVRLEEGRVDLRPIAGTRRRGRNADDEKRMEEELINDPKEKAEHIMLVDLGRNDLGRVCEIGSVTVIEQEIVEKYSHVMHLVSHVTGKIKKGLDAFDVIRSTFPAGTLSGAPKIRAMEIIEELEGSRRGLYGGCVGYISFTGNCDTAITIRTALFKDKQVYVQAGAGVVFNSIPKNEYLECKNKAQALVKALEEGSVV